MSDGLPTSAIICTDLQKEILQQIIASVKTGEPCNVIGIVDTGKHNIFQEVSKYFTRNPQDIDSQTTVVSIISNKQEEYTFIGELEELLSKQKVLAIMRLVGSDDSKELFVKLHILRDLHGHDLVTVIFSDLKPIYSAYVAKTKHLIRGLILHKVFDRCNFDQMIQYFEARFEHKTSKKTQDRIYTLSGGHPGLTKSLFLLSMKRDLSTISQDELMKDESIQFRLETLVNDIPTSVRLTIQKGIPLKEDEKIFFKSIGVLKDDGNIFSPLLSDYLKIKTNWIEMLSPQCTSTELDILRKLQKEDGSVVDRDTIAQCLWGANWENEYSDWAIDQAIHRLREKLTAAKSPYLIRTKKGVGFILEQSSI